jgi:exopolysaccharide production protein ExoQ
MLFAHPPIYQPRSINPVLNLLEKGFTVFVWMYFSSALYCSSLFISADARLTVDEINPLDPLFSKIQLFIYLLTFALLLARWRTTLITLSQQKIVLLLIGLVLVSFLWSDWPDESWRKALNVVGTSCFGIYTAARFTLKEQLKYMTIALGIVAIFSLLFSIARPSDAIEMGANAGSWRGPMTQKNLLARLMVLSCVISLLSAWIADRGKILAWLSCSVSMLMLMLSGSKTGLLVLIVLLALIPLYRALRWRGTLLIPILIAVILIGGTFGTMVVANWESLLLGFGRDPSLSGRTDLWIASIDKIMERPWLGYGFQAFWQDNGGGADIWKIVAYRPPHSHNGYLNMALDLGLVGLMLFLLSLAVSYVQSIRCLQRQKGIIGLFPILYVTFMFMYNHTENTIVEHSSIYWAGFVSICLSLV